MSFSILIIISLESSQTNLSLLHELIHQLAIEEAPEGMEMELGRDHGEELGPDLKTHLWRGGRVLGRGKQYPVDVSSLIHPCAEYSMCVCPWGSEWDVFSLKKRLLWILHKALASCILSSSGEEGWEEQPSLAVMEAELSARLPF